MEENNKLEENQKINQQDYNTAFSHNLEHYYTLPVSKLILELTKEWQIDNLMFVGEYYSSLKGEYGFFKNVKHSSGDQLQYPSLNTPINDMYVARGDFTNGNIYEFEAEIASIKERRKKENPFLLQARSRTFDDSIALYNLRAEIVKAKEIHIQSKKNIDIDLQKIKLEASNTQNEHKKYLEQVTEQKLIVEEQLIKIEKIKEEEDKNLTNLIQKSIEMKNTVQTLQNKIDFCVKLGFLTSFEADKYILKITDKSFHFPENHLNFETDLKGNYKDLADGIHQYLYHNKGLIYTRFQIDNFLTLLLTHDIIVLSGLSGSGKTQIVKAFAEAMGGVAKIIPVKPNWTSSDDLIGYFNPLQSTFMPTPFTEALVEAAQNPDLLYLICLDEMNLARVEYYFADFLSKLEEREHQPEIELYAKHEEELFMSEFKTLMSLMESAIDINEVNSWVDFLSNDKIRNRFFEMLGSTEKDTILQIHTNMRKRLANIIKFPSTLKIPTNVRFIGAINVDETTNYFSAKVLDRVHIVKFENPLLIEDLVHETFDSLGDNTKQFLPIYVSPNNLLNRMSYKKISTDGVRTFLKQLNKEFLLPLNIDFGLRSIRQSENYIEIGLNILGELDLHNYIYIDDDNTTNISVSNKINLNSAINQKIFSRFVFDGDEKIADGSTKLSLLEKMLDFLSQISYRDDNVLNIYHYGSSSASQLKALIESAKLNSDQVNFFA